MMGKTQQKKSSGVLMHLRHFRQNTEYGSMGAPFGPKILWIF